MRLVLLGPPGAGKGTLATLIKNTYGVLHISTGDILREEMKGNSDIGKEVKGYVESGALVPDAVVIKLIENKMMKDPTVKKGYLLDGFPRTKAQAKELDHILEKIGKPIDAVLYMETTVPVIIQRLTGRRICRKCNAIFHVKNKPPKREGICDICGGELYQRPDDKEETIKKRMDVYLTSTKPIIDYYKAQKKLKTVDADQETKALMDFLMKNLNEHAK